MLALFFVALPLALLPGGDAAVYQVTVHTGDVNDAGTDNQVYVRLDGANRSTEFLRLHGDPASFQRGKTDTFAFAQRGLGELRSITVRFCATGAGRDWYLDEITVADALTGRAWHFPYHYWVYSNAGDCALRTLQQA